MPDSVESPAPESTTTPPALTRSTRSSKVPRSCVSSGSRREVDRRVVPVTCGGMPFGCCTRQAYVRSRSFPNSDFRRTCISSGYDLVMIDAAGLRVMKAIADEGSFTSAAHALGFTQPAISQMVRRLEQRTGTVLVERYGRQVRLTEAGQVLARHAVGVLAALDAAEEEITAIA